MEQLNNQHVDSNTENDTQETNQQENKKDYVNGKIWLDRIIRNNISSNELYNRLLLEGILKPEVRVTSVIAVSSLLANFTRNVRRGNRKIYFNAYKKSFDKPVIIDGKKISKTFGWVLCMSVLGQLEKSLMIIRHRGHHTPSSKEDGYIEITEEFFSLIDDCLLSAKKEAKEKRNSLVIRDGVTGDMKLFKKSEGNNTMEIIEQMQKYNKFIAEHEITIGGDIKITPWLCRIFKDNLQTHGRLYNIGELINYQTLSAEGRKEIKFDGMDVVELDYKHLHPSFLYNQEGIEIKEDVYKISLAHDFVFNVDYENKDESYYAVQMRALAKGTLLRMFNTSYKKNCIQSVKKMLSDDSQGASKKFPDLKSDHLEIATALVESLENKHKVISHKFYKEYSLPLMFMDSSILMKVLSACLFEGILALPIHDSILVPENYADEVEVIMEESYADFMGSSLNCIIERK